MSNSILVEAGWKDMNGLMNKLVKLLPELGLNAHNINTGSDCYSFLVTRYTLTDEQADHLYNEMRDDNEEVR